MDKAILVDTVMHLQSVTFDRIEDQCLARFAARFPDDTHVLSKKQLAHVLVMWLEFWNEERPISKGPPIPVIQMKQMICDAKITHIRDHMRKWDVVKQVPEYLVSKIPN